MEASLRIEIMERASLFIAFSAHKKGPQITLRAFSFKACAD
jgi:hypothetical protein